MRRYFLFFKFYVVCIVFLRHIYLLPQALELKKLQTPLYEEFYNSFNASCSPSFVEKARDENSPNYLKLPPKSQSPNQVPSGTPSAAVDGMNSASPGSSGRQVSDVGGASQQGFQDTPSPQHNDQRRFLADADQEASPRLVHELILS